MNNELQTAITDLITGTVNTADQAKDFILAETPEFIQQLLLWKAIYGGVLFFVSIVAFYIIYRCARWGLLFTKEISEREDAIEDSEIARLVVGAVGVIVGCFVIAETLNLRWLQIWIAPKVYLVEYAASLIK